MHARGTSKRPDLVGVATNVITGFLGAGKSTAILHLMRQKPAAERWAVLVNEFGEVGIDGSLLRGAGSSDAVAEAGIFIREVPGGCMCCVAGVPMQIALTRLLAQARPHRLLIEPTGLGHPHEVLQVLAADHYRGVLDLGATIALVDARKIRDPRYAEHPTFRQQLEVADIVVANKADQYDAQDLLALREYLGRSGVLAGKPWFQVEQGALELDWLARPIGFAPRPDRHRHVAMDAGLPVAPELPEVGYLRIDNEGDGYFSQGWIFDSSWVFRERGLFELLSSIDAERVKGVFVTERGASVYNMVDGVLTESRLPEAQDSRIEILSDRRTSFVGVEAALLDCVTSRSGPRPGA